MWPFKKKEEKVKFPYHYAIIVWTDSSLHYGTFDDSNKEIVRIKNNQIIERIPYSEEEVESIREVYQISVADRTNESKEAFEFEEMRSLTGEFSEVRY